MRRAVLLVFLGLAGCGDPALDKCENAVKDTLKAPSTYHRIKAHGAEMKVGIVTYTIEYDAANAFGTPLRGYGFCDYDKVTRTAKWSDMGRPNISD